MMRAAALASCLWLWSPAQAAEFSVTTRIYQVPKADVVSEHRIVFSAGVAYHFVVDQGQSIKTVYDASAGKVTVIDPGSQSQSVIPLDDLLAVTARAKASVTDPEERARLGITAEVNRTEEGYRVEFGGIRYQTSTTAPADPAIAADYGRFADLALRMNILRPTGPPPFARLNLNRQIVDKQEMPQHSSLTIQQGDRSTEFRSVNEVGEWTADDRQRVEQIQAMQREFRQVPLNEFPQRT